MYRSQPRSAFPMDTRAVIDFELRDFIACRVSERGYIAVKLAVYPEIVYQSAAVCFEPTIEVVYRQARRINMIHRKALIWAGS